MTQLTIRDAIRRAMIEEMERDESVFVMGQELGLGYEGTYGITRGMYEQFGGKRMIDTPISEAGMGGVAVGAAMNGLRPILEYMTVNFALLGLDALVNHAAKIHYMFGGQFSCPMVVRTAASWGQLSATHSQTFEAWFSYMPGLKVVYPGTAADCYGLLKQAIRDPDPVIYIEHTRLYRYKGEVPDDTNFTIPIGKSEIKRQGRDVTVVTYGNMLPIVLEAAEELAKEGVECEVVDLRSLRPLDLDPVLTSFKKTYRAAVVTDDFHTAGMSGEIAAQIYEHGFDYLDAPIKRITALEVPLPYAKNLERLAMPSKEDVKAGIMQLV
jgi:pyruvate dehydrogenase E1 component beta subunit